jgi:hypothetical protein
MDRSGKELCRKNKKKLVTLVGLATIYYENKWYCTFFIRGIA